MIRENEYLQEIFSIIVRQVLKNLIRSKFKQERTCKDNSEEDYFIRKINDTCKALNKRCTYKHLQKVMTTQLEIPIYNSELEHTLRSIIRYEKDNNFESIDFSKEVNCLTCVFTIFEFYEREYNIDNIRDRDIKFKKNEVESTVILEKKNMMLRILAKCVDNFPIDQELKEKAILIIQNVAKKIRESFIDEEKDDIERILNKLKFRLKSIIELEKDDVLGKLISTETLQANFNQNPFDEQLLVEKTKSALRNIVKAVKYSLTNIVEDPQLDILKETNQQDYDKTINENNKESHQEAIMEIEQSTNSQDLKIKTKRKRSSKEKKNDKRKSKSMKIHHLPTNTI
jgi:hypothetical protein